MLLIALLFLSMLLICLSLSFALLPSPAQSLCLSFAVSLVVRIFLAPMEIGIAVYLADKKFKAHIHLCLRVLLLRIDSSKTSLHLCIALLHRRSMLVYETVPSRSHPHTYQPASLPDPYTRTLPLLKLHQPKLTDIAGNIDKRSTADNLIWWTSDWGTFRVPVDGRAPFDSHHFLWILLISQATGEILSSAANRIERIRCSSLFGDSPNNAIKVVNQSNE